MVQTDEAVRRMTKDVYALKEQCDKCKIGDKEIGPKSGVSCMPLFQIVLR